MVKDMIAIKEGVLTKILNEKKLNKTFLKQQGVDYKTQKKIDNGLEVKRTTLDKIAKLFGEEINLFFDNEAPKSAITEYKTLYSTNDHNALSRSLSSIDEIFFKEISTGIEPKWYLHFKGIDEEFKSKLEKIKDLLNSYSVYSSEEKFSLDQQINKIELEDKLYEFADYIEKEKNLTLRYSKYQYWEREIDHSPYVDLKLLIDSTDNILLSIYPKDINNDYNYIKIDCGLHKYALDRKHCSKKYAVIYENGREIFMNNKWWDEVSDEDEDF